VKFLHCADIHIDSPLRGLSRGEGVPAEEIRLAARAAFDNLIALATDEGVSAVIIAGDLYDGDRDDYDTAIYLQRQFARLRDAGIPVVVTYGNHDAASEITRRLRPPDNVTVLSHRSPETILLEDAGLAVHGQSYGKRAVTDDLALAYPDPVPGYLNVGVLHTCLDGRPGHEPYAPCRLDWLLNRGYAYWALGHVHARYEVERDGVWVVFPGTVQGRHARETGAKGATLVEYDGDRISSVEGRELDTVRWSLCEVDVSEAVSADDVQSAAVSAVDALTAHDPGRLFAVRLELKGATAAADELLRDRETWEAQLRADLAGARGRVWLEKVKLGVTPPHRAGVAGEEGEAIASVRETLSGLREDEAARAELASTLAALRSKLGGDMPRLTELGCPDLTEDCMTALLDDVEQLLLSQLQGG